MRGGGERVGAGCASLSPSFFTATHQPPNRCTGLPERAACRRLGVAPGRRGRTCVFEEGKNREFFFFFFPLASARPICFFSDAPPAPRASSSIPLHDGRGRRGSGPSRPALSTPAQWGQQEPGPQAPGKGEARRAGRGGHAGEQGDGGLLLPGGVVGLGDGGQHGECVGRGAHGHHRRGGGSAPARPRARSRSLSFSLSLRRVVQRRSAAVSILPLFFYLVSEQPVPRPSARPAPRPPPYQGRPDQARTQPPPLPLVTSVGARTPPTPGTPCCSLRRGSAPVGAFLCVCARERKQA